MKNFKHAVLTANTFKELPNTVQRYIRNNYLIINPDESIIAYYSNIDTVIVEYKNIVLSVEI